MNPSQYRALRAGTRRRRKRSFSKKRRLLRHNFGHLHCTIYPSSFPHSTPVVALCNVVADVVIQLAGGKAGAVAVASASAGAVAAGEGWQRSHAVAVVVLQLFLMGGGGGDGKAGEIWEVIESEVGE